MMKDRHEIYFYSKRGHIEVRKTCPQLTRDKMNESQK